MSSIPPITKSDILQWTDKVYFERGQKYFERGAIYEQRRQGMAIKSKCSGTQAPFYRQEVLFDRKGIKSAECSCPVGDDGYCKHVVALLLTWMNDPGSFQEVESLDTVLEKRSKPELIALIKEMLEQEPDLESLLELPLSIEENKPLNVKSIRQQAERAFHGLDYEWGYTREIRRDLKPLLKLAANSLARGDAETSALVYMSILDVTLDNSDAAVGDEEEVLLGIIYDCAESLGECLSQIEKPKKQREILQVLFSVYQWDVIKMGGIGAADCVPEILTAQTTPQERAEIAAWTREILPKGDSWSDGYHREVLGRLLLELEADTLDDEAYLKICRETGRLNDLIERLLELNRIKEAEEAARAAGDYPLFRILDIFSNYGQDALAEKLVTDRLQTLTDERLVEWLANRLEQRGDLAGSLELQERLFWKYRDLERYKKLRKLAKRLNRWESLRAHIITELENRKDAEFLVRLYLSEKDVGNALATLEKMPPRWRDHTIYIDVAQAARKQFPQEAIRLFTKEAERFIDERNRGSYSEAARCLREVRDIHRKLNEIQAWDKLIAELRERFRRLPALQDELNQLKL
ncbi:MAG TPA: SWIM zinc finger family protein [Anaerolineales bacterium]|nr:SWIM zinc finger family protein [Anaerolineales bacterium]